MTTDPKDAEQARKALHKAEKEYCSNFDKGAVFIWADKGTVFHWAERGAYMLKADAQAEIARLNQQWEDHDAAWSERVAVLTQENARLTAENEIRWKMEQKWQDRAEKAEAERDAALAQVARLQHLIRAASDPDFLWGAMDNVNDMDADITEFANAASRAIRASIPILAAAEKGE